MGKVGRFDEALQESPLLYFCPVKSPASLVNDGKCSNLCMWHTTRKRLCGGKVIFSGCRLVWLCRKEDIEWG